MKNLEQAYPGGLVAHQAQWAKKNSNLNSRYVWVIYVKPDHQSRADHVEQVEQKYLEIAEKSH
jgi:helix-turn-helix protein